MRPNWCEDITCSHVCYMPTMGGGQCIGKLAEPTDHVTKAVNLLTRCHYDKVSSILRIFHINKEDMIVDIYLNGEGLRFIGESLPSAIIDNLPVPVANLPEGEQNENTSNL